MGDKNDLAKDRTDWAEDRTILANERTFAGWMRTGTASLAIAVGLRALFDDVEPTWMPKAVSTNFILLAVYIFWAAQASAGKTQKRLDDHHAHAQPNGRLKVIASIFAAASICVGIFLWLICQTVYPAGAST